MQRTPGELLSRLFEYAEESLMEFEASRYQLASSKNEVFTPAQLTALPGLRFDLRLPGDSIWIAPANSMYAWDACSEQRSVDGARRPTAASTMQSA